MMPLLSVFALAMVEIWLAVPTGLALGQPPALVWVVTIAGSLLGVTIVAALGSTLGSRLRGWMARRSGQRVTGSSRLNRIWLRYGVLGWGVLSPLLMAPPMGTAVAMVLGAPRGSLLIAMTLGVVTWTSLLVIAGMLGIEALHTIR
jgi:hypothetical protein